MNTNIEELASRYPRFIFWSEEDGCYIGSLPDICGNCCHGETIEEVSVQLTEIAESWVDTFLEEGRPLPVIRSTVVRIANGKEWSQQNGKVSDLRKRTGLSQSGFASLLGIPLSTYRKWEQGVRRPSGSGAKLLEIVESHPDLISELAKS